MNKYGIRVDIQKKFNVNEINPDYLCDAHEVSKLFDKQEFDVILADPPYSTKEAKEIYNTPPLKYKIWTNECDKILTAGGLLIVYHKFIMPNPNPDKYDLVKRVFIGTRTHHTPRAALYFRKRRKDDKKFRYNKFWQ
jgi:16S rRNA G966 N2-methylase RsmD